MDAKQHRDWTKIVGDRLRESEVAPPTDGWQRLERELGGLSAPVTGATPRWRIYGLRTAVAAAVLLAAALVGEWLWRPTPEQMQVSLPELATTQTQPIETTPQSVESAPEMAQAQATPILHRQSAARPATASAIALPSDQSATTPKEAITETATETAEPAQNTSPQPQKQAATRSSVSARSASANSQPNREPFRAARPAHQKTSVGLFAGGSVSGNNANTTPTMASLSADAPGFDLAGSNEAIEQRKVDDYPLSSFRHHQPIGFGLSVRKEFRYGISVESGVNYTYLRSDVRRLYASEDMTQSLHFIGIPLRVNWQCFDRQGFSLYIGAGGTIEKCVAAKLGSESFDEKGVQWSLQGVAGAEYRLGGRVGLYFEPEVSYYLTETYLRTARTETPLSVTLRLGVRLSF